MQGALATTTATAINENAKKRNGFVKQSNNFARAFLCHHFATTT